MKIGPILRTTRELLVNVALPYAIYSWLRPSTSDVNALIAASAPPLLWSIFEFVRAKKLDALSLIVLSGICLSILAYFGGGSVRFLQLREKLVTLLIATAFLGSAAIGRPLMYEVIRAFLSRSGDSALKKDVESRRNEEGVKHSMTVMTLVWGFGLLADGLASIALVYVLAIKTYLIVNPVLGNATIGSLTLWSVLYGRHRRKQGLAQRVAAAQAGIVQSS